MRAPKLLYLVAVVFVCCFTCGAQDSTAINGNWHLTGSWNSRLESPQLILSLGMARDKLLGMGSFQFNCPNNVGLGITLVLAGQIAADGAFLLTEPQLAKSNDSVTMTISGKIPDPASGQWSGTYSFTKETKHGKCSTADNFVATKLPPLSGVFSGTLRLLDRSEVAVTVDISQGELVTFETPTGTLGRVPLQATMTLSGSDKFPSKRLNTDTSVANRVQGNGFFLQFPANNGERISLGGDYIDASVQNLRVQLRGSGLDALAFGTLTRQ
jgi:hypothetical protein